MTSMKRRMAPRRAFVIAGLVVVVLTAWGIQLEVESVDDDRIAGFIDLYQRGSQTPEPGAPCTGGIGEPVG